MDLSIIIVSYNSKDITLKCLQSLMESNDRLKREIIIIDNASSDGSIEAVSKQYKEVTCVVNSDNGGFGKANNQAAQLATGKYLLFLNSDTEVFPDTLSDLWEGVEIHQSSLATCKLLNPDGSIQPQGGALPTLGRIFAWMFFIDDIPLINKLFQPYQQRNTSYFTQDQLMGWIGGTAMLIKRDLFAHLGGFDESIFMYGEDVELCFRARLKGYVPHYFAKPQITHIGQASGSSSNAILGEFKGIRYIYKKHYPAWKLPLVRLMLKLGALLRIIFFGMIRKDATRKSIYTEAFSLA